MAHFLTSEVEIMRFPFPFGLTEEKLESKFEKRTFCSIHFEVDFNLIDMKEIIIGRDAQKIPNFGKTRNK